MNKLWKGQRKKNFKIILSTLFSLDFTELYHGGEFDSVSGVSGTNKELSHIDGKMIIVTVQWVIILMLETVIRNISIHNRTRFKYGLCCAKKKVSRKSEAF